MTLYFCVHDHLIIVYFWVVVSLMTSFFLVYWIPKVNQMLELTYVVG